MFIKLCRLGKKPEINYTPKNEPVINLDLAYSIGYGDNEKTQWIRGAFFGERAAKIQPYLEKGKLLLVTANDLQVEAWTGKDGNAGYTLKCRVMSLEFAGGKDDAKADGNQSAPQAAPQARPTATAAPQQHTHNHDDLDDSIPF
jgi:single-strand DNA-binding protein